jgi:hypothetical protein
VKRFRFPLIDATDVKRLPRTLSYGDDRDAGRVLIALRYTGPRRTHSKVLIRNCYRSDRYSVVVENIREYVPAASPHYTGKMGVSLKKLLRTGLFEVVKPPFKLTEPMQNCMLEMNAADFEREFKENRDTSLSAIDALRFQPDLTPMLRLLKVHWKEQHVHDGWTADRVRRVCVLWNLTPFELAELIQWAPGHMDHFLKAADKGTWRLPGPVAVWFYFLENFRFGISVFPSLPEELKKAS